MPVSNSNEPVAGDLVYVPGLVGEYFSIPVTTLQLSDIDFTAEPIAKNIVTSLNTIRSANSFWQGGLSDYFAAKYTGALFVEKPGNYTFYLTSDEGSALYLDGERAIVNDGAHATSTRNATLRLTAGYHDLEILYFELKSSQSLKFEWVGPDTLNRRITVEGNSLQYQIPYVPPNSAPIATDDAYSTKHNIPLAISLTDLLSNDSDVDNDALSFVNVESVTGGSAAVSGTFILFTPDNGFEGIAKLVYSITDGKEISSANVSINVAGPAYADSLVSSLVPGIGLSDPSLAVGLDSFSYWKSPPFLNIMKQGGAFATRDATRRQLTVAELVSQGYMDNNGYPIRMYPGNETLASWERGYYMSVAIHFENDFVRQETSGDYVVEWAGEGEIQLRDFAVRTRETLYASDGTIAGGKMTGTWDYSDALKYVLILRTDPNGTGNYIRDISIVRTEYKDLYDVGAIFDPRYTALIKDHHTLRFMDWMRTNGSDVKTLNDVATLDSMTWAGAVNAGTTPEVSSTDVLPIPVQVPFEVMIRLANETGTDPWFNIPLKADDGYVRALAKYVEDNLDEGLIAKFELSNEVWNWAGGFEQTREASLLGSNGITSTDIMAARNFYGYRSAKIREILNEEMSRVSAEIILGTQTVYFALARAVEPGVARYFTEQGKIGTMSDVFDSLAVTGYFGEIAHNDFIALRQFWYTRSAVEFAAGNTPTKHDFFVKRAAAYMANGVSILSPEELALITKLPNGTIRPELMNPLEGNLRAMFAENKRMANGWGLELIQYEADSHIAPRNYNSDPESEWYKALNKSPEVGALTARMAEIFREEGGTLVTDFGHLGDTAYGLWGTRSHLADQNPISAAYDNYNETASTRLGSINAGRDLSAFLNGVTKKALPGGDVIIGSHKRDYLIGNDGNDLFVCGSGSAGVNGGSGVDMVLFAGKKEDYTYTVEGKVLVVSAGRSKYRLLDIELLAFLGNREFARVSDYTGSEPVADLQSLLTSFDAGRGIVETFF